MKVKTMAAGKRTGHHALVLVGLGLLAPLVNGQEREDVQFQITHETYNCSRIGGRPDIQIAV